MNRSESEANNFLGNQSGIVKQEELQETNRIYLEGLEAKKLARSQRVIMQIYVILSIAGACLIARGLDGMIEGGVL